jgi:hypothetical protein
MIRSYNLEDLSFRDYLFSLLSKKYETVGNKINIFNESCPFTDWVIRCAKEYDGNDYVVDRGWASGQLKNKLNPSMPMHNHKGFLVGVFYLNTVEGHPDLFVCDTSLRSNILNIENLIPNEDSIDLKFKLIRIKPEINKLVLFPGNYLHGVGMNTLDTPRISIAMNLRKI